MLRGTGASNNQVQGNYIGLQASGTAGLGNAGKGISIEGSGGNYIGGGPQAAVNVICSNGNAGITVDGAGATANVRGHDLYLPDASGDPPAGAWKLPYLWHGPGTSDPCAGGGRQS